MTTTVPVSTADYRHKKVFEGFKEFISRGNTLDMAVGVVMGNAVTAIVKSLVSNFLNPLIAMIFGKPDMSGLLRIHFNGATISFGAILNDILNFLLVALAVYFCVIVPINKFRDLTDKAKKNPAVRKMEFWKKSDEDSTDTDAKDAEADDSDDRDADEEDEEDEEDDGKDGETEDGASGTLTEDDRLAAARLVKENARTQKQMIELLGRISDQLDALGASENAPHDNGRPGPSTTTTGTAAQKTRTRTRKRHR